MLFNVSSTFILRSKRTGRAGRHAGKAKSQDFDRMVTICKDVAVVAAASIQKSPPGPPEHARYYRWSALGEDLALDYTACTELGYTHPAEGRSNTLETSTQLLAVKASGFSTIVTFVLGSVSVLARRRWTQAA